MKRIRTLFKHSVLLLSLIPFIQMCFFCSDVMGKKSNYFSTGKSSGHGLWSSPPSVFRCYPHFTDGQNEARNMWPLFLKALTDLLLKSIWKSHTLLIQLCSFSLTYPATSSQANWKKETYSAGIMYLPAEHSD